MSNDVINHIHEFIGAVLRGIIPVESMTDDGTEHLECFLYGLALLTTGTILHMHSADPGLPHFEF